MTDTSPNWMIYGATGYTGRLVADLAVARGHRPVLAGRSRSVERLAAALGLRARVFDLEDPALVGRSLAGCRVVAHCAGPFSATSRPMIDACLSAGTHYVDITGEIDVFEAAFRRHDEARARAVVICPGVGFDVIPTDCVAATLAEVLPGATRLALGFDTASGVSAGTARTTLEALPGGGRVRRAGRVETIPLGSLTRTIDFGRGPRRSMAIPWGDVATAFATTRIPNIEVYVPMPRAAAFAIRCLQPARRLFATAGVRRTLQSLVGHSVGPSPQSRAAAPTWVWGEACDGAARTAVARLRTANVYDVTAHGVVMAVEHLVESDDTGGVFTPSRLLGPRCVERIPGSTAIAVEVQGP
jgi:short subunit dehydrogenase-like uncharacterized protein